MRVVTIFPTSPSRSAAGASASPAASSKRAAKAADNQGEKAVQKKTLRFGRGFRVALGNARSQAAEMVIPPGDAEGDPHNRHRGADQWLFAWRAREWRAST